MFNTSRVVNTEIILIEKQQSRGGRNIILKKVYDKWELLGKIFNLLGH